MVAGLTLLPVVRPIEPFVEALGAESVVNLFIAGGYPLYLMGGAPHYDDIDVYAANWDTFYRYFWEWESFRSGYSREAVHHVIDGLKVQLIKPHNVNRTMLGYMRNTDFSASACTLTHRSGEWKVWHLYPEDVERRLCRVLVEHDWTEFRKDVYQKKGYRVIPLSAQ